MIFYLLALFYAEYFIAIKKNEGDIFSSFESYTPLKPPKGRFYADPFIFKYEGVNYLFFENYDYKKGIISYIPLEKNFPEPKTALELATHLSFPFLFTDNDALYMMPETYQDRSISIFKCLVFPHTWEKSHTLLKGRAYSDPILFKQGSYYWLFTAINQDQLQIFYSTSLHAPFKAHPINRQHKKGRNAGPVFYKEGQLIRPTMDCQKGYGKRVIFKQIITLTPEHFVEKPIGTLEPTWAPELEGTHSFSCNEDFVVYDGWIKKTLKEEPQ